MSMSGLFPTYFELTLRLRSVLVFSLVNAENFLHKLQKQWKTNNGQEIKQLRVLTVNVKSRNIKDSSENLEHVERKMSKH